MISEIHKQWIDNADYESLLGMWRNAPSGDSIFQGETGDYFASVMAIKRSSIGDGGHVAASKSIGWR